jgi:hypothetical protein
MRTLFFVLSVLVLSAPMARAEFVVKASFPGDITTPQNSVSEPTLNVAVEMDGDLTSREMFVAFNNQPRVGIAHVESAHTEIVETGHTFTLGVPNYQFAYYDFDGDGLLDVLVPVGDETLVIGWSGAPASSPEPGSNEANFDQDLQLQALPNPSAGNTTIAFSLATPSNVSVVVFDASGRLLRTVQNAVLGVGQHRIEWDGRDERGSSVPAGVYFSQVQAGSITVTGRIVVTR